MEDRKSKTLFIRNLPFTTNNDALEKVFSEIGPLKQCFVVKKKGSYLSPLVYVVPLTLMLLLILVIIATA